MCDRLNRAQTMGTLTYTQDILGKCLSKSTIGYTRDCLNRFVGLTGTRSGT